MRLARAYAAPAAESSPAFAGVVVSWLPLLFLTTIVIRVTIDVDELLGKSADASLLTACRQTEGGIHSGVAWQGLMDYPFDEMHRAQLLPRRCWIEPRQRLARVICKRVRDARNTRQLV
jgi:hypothetical protein